MNYSITFRVQNELQLICKQLQHQTFFWGYTPEPLAKKKGKGIGRSRKRREGSEEGGREFALCHRNKKEKSVPMPDRTNAASLLKANYSLFVDKPTFIYSIYCRHILLLLN
jgi:hypothetical protein